MSINDILSASNQPLVPPTKQSQRIARLHSIADSITYAIGKLEHQIDAFDTLHLTGTANALTGVVSTLKRARGQVWNELKERATLTIETAADDVQDITTQPWKRPTDKDVF